MRVTAWSVGLIVLFRLVFLAPGVSRAEKAWPDYVQVVSIKSSMDGVECAAMFWSPGKSSPSPLLVALHTWSGDYTQPNAEYLDWCREKGWILIHPDFRGPNNRPAATGSSLAVQDVLDAVEFARKHARVDENRVYLAGVSGGGYMSLLLAGRHPGVWAAVTSWVPITDLAAWYHESTARRNKYARDILLSCGGPPGSSPAVSWEYRARSPLTFLNRAAGLPIDINAGIHDGHTGSVPVSHSLGAFNMLARANGFPGKVIPQKAIDYIVAEEKIPPELAPEKVDDPLYGREILFRREAGPARITLFEGGHEIIYRAALSWLEGKKRGASGVVDKPAR